MSHDELRAELLDILEVIRQLRQSNPLKPSIPLLQVEQTNVMRLLHRAGDLLPLPPLPPVSQGLLWGWCGLSEALEKNPATAGLVTPLAEGAKRIPVVGRPEGFYLVKEDEGVFFFRHAESVIKALLSMLPAQTSKAQRVDPHTFEAPAEQAKNRPIEARISEEDKALADHLFVDEGGLWHLRFPEAGGPTSKRIGKDLGGLAIIHTLLKRAGREFPVADLAGHRVASIIPTDQRKSEELRRKFAQLASQARDCDEQLEADLREKLRMQMQDLAEQIRELQPVEQAISQDDDDRVGGRHRKRIDNLIRTARRAIASIGMPALAAHLEHHVTSRGSGKDATFVYRTIGEPIIWTL